MKENIRQHTALPIFRIRNRVISAIDYANNTIFSFTCCCRKKPIRSPRQFHHWFSINLRGYGYTHVQPRTGNI